MTKTIPLTNSESVALVDDTDYERLAKSNWQLVGGYATRTDKDLNIGTVYMHREILGLKKGEDRRKRQGDHINGDKLDNRRKNLRVVTASKNKLMDYKRRPL